MSGSMKKSFCFLLTLIPLIVASCEKVSPIEVFVATVAVEDRVKMSNLYFKNHLDGKLWLLAEVSFLYFITK